MGITTWSDEAVTVLKTYFATETATQIADRLAKMGEPFSRCAIIGKARRLGLYLPQTGTGHRRPRGPNKLPRKPKAPKSNIRSWNASFGNPVSVTRTAPVFVDLPSETGRLSILDLEPHHCRFTADEVTFCGDPIADNHPSYCRRHAMRCGGRLYIVQGGADANAAA